MQSQRSAIVRRLSSAIHPPLPMTPRQTSQLLASLTSSFQRHLDQNYPSPRSGTSGPSPALASASKAASAPHATSLAASSSLSETSSHFDSIIAHPAFAGLQQSPAQSASAAEQAAYKILKAAEDKLKYGTFNVFEAADLFRALYRPAMQAATATSSSPAGPAFSFASRYISLVKSCGSNTVQQFLSTRRIAAMWTRLMFHEQRQHEIVPIMRNTDTIYQVLPQYLSSLLRTRGLSALVHELEALDQLVESGYLQLTQGCCRKNMLLVSHTILSLENPQHPANKQLSSDSPHETEWLSSAIFGGPAAPCTNMLYAVTKLVLEADAAPLLALVKHVQSEDQELNFWTDAPFRRRLLLSAILKAASSLLGISPEAEQQQQQQTQHADAQYLLQFAEVVFAEELHVASRRDGVAGEEVDSSHPTAGARLAHATASAPAQDATILNRLNGLLLG